MIGVIVFVKLVGKLMGIELNEEGGRLEKEGGRELGELRSCLLGVRNGGVFGGRVRELKIGGMRGGVI